mmetsp:Transcript_8156/g.22113  ORF Transcript_8156/g.22113 Transcript_8156/m.22113 type:complete len:246 (-) Transcript_8156:256-993(-)
MPRGNISAGFGLLPFGISVSGVRLPFLSTRLDACMYMARSSPEAMVSNIDCHVEGSGAMPAFPAPSPPAGSRSPPMSAWDALPASPWAMSAFSSCACAFRRGSAPRDAAAFPRTPVASVEPGGQVGPAVAPSSTTGVFFAPPSESFDDTAMKLCADAISLATLAWRRCVSTSRPSTAYALFSSLTSSSFPFSTISSGEVTSRLARWAASSFSTPHSRSLKKDSSLVFRTSLANSRSEPAITSFPM